MKILHFKTHAQIKDILGQELINDDNVAIQELVKNSYDAGNKQVDIIFKNIKENKDLEINNSNRDKQIDQSSKIIIIDQGCGMNLDDINDKWLNLAYSMKRVNPAKKGRLYAGNKGVGRFSCDRLGEYLDLYTKTVKDTKIIHLKINWNEFEDKLKVDDIVEKVNIYLEDSLTLAEFERKTGYKIGTSGTVLEISKLRAKWIEKDGNKYSYYKIINLKKALQKLTNPNQNIDKEGFKIKVQVLDLSKKDFDLKTETSKAEFEILNKELVENKIFTQLNFRTTYIESVLDDDAITTSLKYQDKIIFELKEKNAYNALNGTKIKIKLHFLNQYSKSYFKKYTGMKSREFGSIFLFVNGFRISPYGDSNNDWLGLEIRKGQGTARFLGARDLVGWIEINDESNAFKIISNREGLVKNKQYQQLVGDTPKNFIDSYFYAIFRKLESFVVDGLDWDRIYKKKKDDEDAVEEDERSEIRKFMSDFEAEISSNKWKYDPSKEKYAESAHEKNMRIINQIFSIVTYGTRKKDILSLYINEELLYELAEENVDFVKSIVKKIDELKDLNLSNKTSKGISQIKKIFSQMEKKQKTIEEERKKAETRAIEAEKRSKQAEEKALKEEQKRKHAEQEKVIAEHKAKEEQGKREASEKREIFVKSLLGKNTEEILKLQHQIKIISGNIESAMLNVNYHGFRLSGSTRGVTGGF